MKIYLFSWTIYNVFFMTSTMFVNAIYQQDEPQVNGWINNILGPLGALAFSLVAVYALYKFNLAEKVKNEELVKKIIADKDKEIESLKKINERLIEKIKK